MPLWIAKVGLYPYLGVEILIWSIYALAFNLVLGTAGLPSFGHGAYFGVGAYAFGLAQFNLVANLWICLGAAARGGGLAGLLVALFISHRRGIYYAFMTIAFGQIFWTIAIKSHRITGGEDGLLQDRAAAGRLRRRVVRPQRQRRALLFRARAVRRRRGGAVAARAFALRARALRDPPERDSRRAPRLPRLALQAQRVRALRGASPASPAACSPWRSSPPSPTS